MPAAAGRGAGGGARRPALPIGSRAGLIARIVVVVAGALVHVALKRRGGGGDGAARAGEAFGAGGGEAAAVLLSAHPLVDAHADTPWAWRTKGRPAADFGKRGAHAGTHADVPRLRAGGVAGVVWAAYVECEGVDEGDGARAEAALTLAYGLRLVAEHAPALRLATSAADVRAAHAERAAAVVLGLEGAHTLGGGGARALADFVALGVRVLTLAHNCHTSLAESCCDAGGGGGGGGGGGHGGGYGGGESERAAGWGLTAEGLEVVRAANALGVLLDLSHTSDATAKAVLEASRAPVAWTHSNARALAEHPRNVPDGLLDRIKENGARRACQGACRCAPRRAARAVREGRACAGARELDDRSLTWPPARPRACPRARALAHPARAVPARACAGGIVMATFVPSFLEGGARRATDHGVPMARVADHVEYLAERVGARHVGLGSDFDGIAFAPDGLGDAAAMPALVAELLRRESLTEDDVAGIVGGNFLRVLEGVEAAADGAGAAAANASERDEL